MASSDSDIEVSPTSPMSVDSDDPDTQGSYFQYLNPNRDPACQISRSTRWRWQKRLKTLEDLGEVAQIEIEPREDHDVSEHDFEVTEALTECAFEEVLVTQVSSELSNNNSGFEDNEVLNNDVPVDFEVNEVPGEVPADGEGNNLLNDIIFPQSGITGKDIQLLIISLTLRHSLTSEAVSDILELVEGLAGRKIPLSKYLLEKDFKVPPNVVKHTFYCSQCKGPLKSLRRDKILSHDFVCQACQTKNIISLTSRSNFISLDLSFVLKSFLEDPYIQTLILNIRDDNDRADDIISDIKSSSLYKNNIEGKFNFTITFNADGAPIFISSKFTIWPIQIIINELPPVERFRNVLLVGIWYDKCEPNMNLFLQDFSDSLAKLAIEGLNWTLNDQQMNSKITAFCAPVDSVAPPMILNSTQYNGFYGCSYCVHPGKVINRTVKYPIVSDNIDNYPLRTSDTVIQDMRAALNSGQRIRGFKGPSVLINVPGFNIVWGFSIDYMHCVLLGVVKQLIEIWTTYNYNEQNTFYIGNPQKIKSINNRLLKISPPSNIHRTPKPLSERAKWKASEYRSWLLYFSVPCLMGILDRTFLRHFILLQKAIFILLKSEISKQDLNNAENFLKEFVKDHQVHYGEKAMTFNIHLLTHLVSSVKMTGPLWATSTFPFESNNLNLKNFVSGPTGVKTQIINKSMKELKLKSALNQNVNNPFCLDFYNSISKHVVHSKTKNGGNNYKTIQPIGTSYQAIFDNTEVKMYIKVLINNVKYECSKLSKDKKRNNSFAKLTNGKFVQILEIMFLKSGKGFAKVLEFIYEPIVIDNLSPEGCYEITEIEGENVISLNEIQEKLVFFDIEDKQFLCEFPNDVEVQ